MLRDKHAGLYLSEFLKYLASCQPEEGDRLPPLAELSSELGISIASLREQLEVARSLGVVEVRPKTGIRRLPYTFKPAVISSLAYSIAVNQDTFKYYSDLRSHIEAAYYFEAVSLLNEDDQEHLKALVKRAKEKLHGTPIQIPHNEHRELHMSIYRKLNNPYVTGLLESYWDMYEAVGLDYYNDIQYLESVWQYHERMVNSICEGDFASGNKVLAEHMNLINQRSKPAPRRQTFE